MTRRGPPGHLTRPSRGAFFLAASENSCHCPLPKPPLRRPRPPHATAAEADSAAESADTVPRAATAPTVAKPALFRQRVPWTNFPAYPGQPIAEAVSCEHYAH